VSSRLVADEFTTVPKWNANPQAAYKPSWILLDGPSERGATFSCATYRKESLMETLVNTPTQASLDVVRSWKDARYRRSLSAQQLQTLPDHPAGPAMLTDQELKIAGGLMVEEGDFSIPVTTALGCTEFTFHSWKSCGC